MKIQTIRLSVYQQWMDYELEHVSFLSPDFDLQPCLRPLYLPGKFQESYVAQLSLMSDMQNFLTTYKNIGGLFFYSPDTDTLIMKSQKKESYTHRLALQDYIEQYQAKETDGDSRPQIAYWYPVSIQGKNFSD